MLNRRTFIAGIAAGAAATSLPKAALAEEAGLGAVAAQAGIAFGSAFDREIFTDESYRALIAQEARIATTENALKLDWLRHDGPQADFSNADALVDFAERNAIALRGTALAWNDNPPAWLLKLSARERIAIFDRHIDEVVSHYRGRLHSWDVVNEPFWPPTEKPGGYRDGPWFSAMGKDYVPRAFRRAHAADPTMRCVLNEAFCEQEDGLGKSVRPRLLGLVDELQHAGVPLHAVGLQGHLKPQLPFDDAAFVDYLHQIAARKLDIYITELDVDDSAFADDFARRDRAVAKRYGDFLTAVLQVPAVKVVISWHLSDKYSWYAFVPWYAEEVRRAGGTPQRAPRTHLYDAALRKKDAWSAVRQALEDRHA